jgi:hypothetical protein
VSPPASAATKRSAPAKRPASRRNAGTRVHRRVSGPAKPRATRAATAPSLPRRRAPQAPPVGLQRVWSRAAGAARRLRDSHAVDRVVRGRIWIALLGALLIGLVGLNVSLLKLNAAAGRNAEWAKKLRVENADLQARVSRLRSAARIQDAGAAMGLVMPAAADVHYLNVDGRRDARLAAKRETFTPVWTTDDLVSAEPDPAPVAPVLATPEAPESDLQATGATGTTGAAPPVVETQAPPATTPTGATGTGASQQPGTGATVP